jgi:hypothetical protein
MEHLNVFAKQADSYLKLIEQQFLAHPHANHQTYMEHLSDSVEFGLKACVSGGVFITHGIFPFIFEHTGSDMIKALNERLVAKNTKTTVNEDESTTSSENTNTEL